MKSNLYCKILVIGIIVLFIGMGIHSAFAVDTKISMVNKASEEECWECKEVDDRQLVILEKQIKKIEIYTKLLLVLSRDNPEFKEKCQKLSNEITALREINNALKFDFIFENDKSSFICDIIKPIWEALADIIIYLTVYHECYCYDGNPILCNILLVIIASLLALAYPITLIGFIFHCFDFP